jgi:arylamine N-acetyltransferase
MENNLLFLHILRAVGFYCYTTGARIRLRHGTIPDGPYVGLSHTCTIVTVDSGEKYNIDVSFSGDGPTVPMPLKSGDVIPNLGTQEIRLVHAKIDQFETDQEFWIYQYRNRPDAPWNHYYCFLEVPFIQADYLVISNYECTQGYLPENVVIVRFLRDGDRIVGKVMLVNGVVKQNMGGRTHVVKECETEEERIAALKEYFGITLTDEEKEGIRGTITELGRQ